MVMVLYYVYFDDFVNIGKDFKYFFFGGVKRKVVNVDGVVIEIVLMEKFCVMINVVFGSMFVDIEYVDVVVRE